MKFSAFTLLSLLVGASASVESMLRVDRDISADSTFGRALLDKATVVEHARSLANNNNQQGAFMYKYSIKYLGCSSIVQINGEEGGGNNKNQGSMLYTKHLVRFALCPSDSCSSCPNGGQYVVNMQDFVDAYTEAKLTAQEATCENIRENCYCNGQYNDDQTCENQCYSDAGHNECIQYEGQDAFEVQRYLECAEMENQNNNNNGNNGNNYQYGDANGFYGQYYIGPYCSPKDGKSILLGVFYDQGCVNHAEASVYGAKNYGAELPYAKTSMVTLNDCIACMEPTDDDNQNGNNGNNGNNNQNYDVIDLCTNSYQGAAKCEKSMDISYPDSTGCNYITSILPRLEAATRQIKSAAGISSGGGHTASTVFASIFAVTTVLFGSYAYFLYRKIKRGTVNLSSQEALSA